MLALGREEEAFTAYQQGLARHQEMAQGNRALLAMVGLAAILLQRGKLEEARPYLDELCAGVDAYEQEATEEVLLLYQRAAVVDVAAHR